MPSGGFHILLVDFTSFCLHRVPGVAKGVKKKSVVAAPAIPPVSSRPTAATPSRVSSFFVRRSFRFVAC